MTGYGRGAVDDQGVRVSVEIRAVNHRFLDLKVRGGALSPELEEAVGGAIRSRLERGSVIALVRIERNRQQPGVRVDQEVAKRIHAELSELRAALGLEEPVPLALICRQPGVLVTGEPEQAEDDSDEARAHLRSCARAAVDQALDALVAMRSTEGAHLAREFERRLSRLAELVEDIARRAELAPAEARKRLEERLARLLEDAGSEGKGRGAAARSESAASSAAAASSSGAGGAAQVDPVRLAQEVAFLADRLDITEELVRLRGHLAHAAELSAETGAIGRRFEFLLQELGREFNTVTSKSQSADIARLVVEAKAELEKLREQVQNVE
ncbi:YicC family protein [Haliangium ochraceum]|uniref:YicC domain protein n=1 Tax=Haliangium ochraceum (strain DSM 14365 / JCM 11303 / SMP-2) TaxID=502025 RepID=D0LIG3_HALO1|nr:DUF1732 domain-containing protein [Haliangium ochraceum]ACY18319.1 domain of unknown function DUF1732 [Haliangium ochraceum DSM 14365]